MRSRGNDVERPAYLFNWALALTLLALAGALLLSWLVVTASLAVLWIGIPMTLGALGMIRGFANFHRDWAARQLGAPIPRPYRRIPASANLYQRTLAILRDPATFRDALWLVVNSSAGVALTSLVVGLWGGVVYNLVLPFLWMLFPELREVLSYTSWIDGNSTLDYVIVWAIAVPYALLALRFSPPLMRTYATLTRSLLAPDERAVLAQRVEDLAESRAETVDAQAAEIRRIERDLHDGAQAKLVSLGMNLGMAEDILEKDPAAAKDLLAEARRSTGQALDELRGLVRGIHPPVLADRGLDGAVRALALSLPLPVDVDSELTERPPAPVEAAAYFAVVEALTNTIKHSAATRAWVRLRHEDGLLRIEVGDDGMGGARSTPGGGLHGVERRLSAFDGILAISSPIGGPTIVTMEIPCDLSSAKTSRS
jgi:signal transduction histidine kinase